MFNRGENSNTLHKGFIFLSFLILSGCSSIHRTASMSWEGERIRIAITPPGGSGALTCLTCNAYFPPIPLSENEQGIAYLKIGEVSNSITSRFYLEASGIDSALTLQPLPIEEANRKYKLQPPLTGRLMITERAIVYEDSTMAKSIGELSRMDEANLFSESEVFYYVHHPAYAKPVVVLRSHAFRIQ